MLCLKQPSMTIIDYLRKQFIDEGKTTRAFLSRITDEQFSFKPHPKSMDLKTLAGHVADLPGWVHMTLTTDELDFANSPGQEPIATADAMRDYFERRYNEGLSVLVPESEALLQQPWTLRNGETVYLTEPKADILRMSLSQQTHHRAQLGVYLRLLNVPIPGSYGPSADENAFA